MKSDSPDYVGKSKVDDCFAALGRQNMVAESVPKRHFVIIIIIIIIVIFCCTRAVGIYFFLVLLFFCFHLFGLCLFVMVCFFPRICK